MDSSIKKACHSICRGIPSQYLISVLAFLSIFTQYTMRICLHLAITEMTYPVGFNDTDPSQETIIKTECHEIVVPAAHDRYSKDPLYLWSEQIQGIILSSFYWGYTLSHFASALVADRYPRILLRWSVLITAIMTLLTPLAIDIGGAVVLVAFRVIEGLAQGATFPVLSALISHWVPPHQRTWLGSFIYSGGQFGSLIGGIGTGFMIHHFQSWRIVFYVWGSLAIAWYIMWVIFGYDSPGTHPYIQEREKAKMAELFEGCRKNPNPGSIPWREIVTCVPFWALVCGQIGFDSIFYLISINLPKYMKSTLGLDVRENGILSYCPFFLMWMSSIATGWIADKQISSGCLSRTNTRKFWCTIGSLFSGTLLLAASHVGCRKWLVVAFFTLAILFMSGYYPGMKVNANDLSPNFAGFLMAFVNGIGAVCGIIVPWMVGLLTPNQTSDEWRLVFWITFFVILTTNVLFNVFASGNIQRWNDSSKSSQKIEMDCS